MTHPQDLTDPTVKTRFVFSNHTLYNTPEALERILAAIDLPPLSIDIACEPWWASTGTEGAMHGAKRQDGWWDNPKFVASLTALNVPLQKPFQVRTDKHTVTQRHIPSQS
jgi:hypothetical protein